MVQNDQHGPQQWSEENTAAYKGSPPPNRLSTQRANDRYKDRLDGQLIIVNKWYYVPCREDGKTETPTLGNDHHDESA